MLTIFTGGSARTCDGVSRRDFLRVGALTAGGLALNDLLAWQNFYVIVGSSAGALIGVPFVVIALIAGSRRRADTDAIHAFGTPTVVHFTGALTVSAMMLWFLDAFATKAHVFAPF